MPAGLGQRLDDAVIVECRNQLGQVMAAIAERVIDRGQAAREVTDAVLGRHADAAVQLDRFLADVPAGLADLQLGA